MRFHGAVGYGDTVEKAAGVFQDEITEVQYFGDVVRNSRLLHSGENLNNDISVSNSISIVADAYASENFMKIRYVVWQGTRFTVSDVQMARPRLILMLGEVYNGPVPTGTSDSSEDDNG